MPSSSVFEATVRRTLSRPKETALHASRLKRNSCWMNSTGEFMQVLHSGEWERKGESCMFIFHKLAFAIRPPTSKTEWQGVYESAFKNTSAASSREILTVRAVRSSKQRCSSMSIGKVLHTPTVSVTADYEAGTRSSALPKIHDVFRLEEKRILLSVNAEAHKTNKSTGQKNYFLKNKKSEQWCLYSVSDTVSLKGAASAPSYSIPDSDNRYHPQMFT